MKPSEILLNALLNIKQKLDGDIESLISGICGNVGNFIDEMDEVPSKERRDLRHVVNRIMQKYFLEWPEFSGCEVFPVKAPSSSTSSEEVYYLNTRAIEHWTGEYGASRIRLLDFMIEQLQVSV